MENLFDALRLTPMGIALMAALAALAMGTSGCAKTPPGHGARYAGGEFCLPEFPDEDGWFGGDAAYSVSIGRTSLASPTPAPAPVPTHTTSPAEVGISMAEPVSFSLWFFGDSFVANEDAAAPGHAPGRVYPFIHNAVGRSDCGQNGQWRIDYDWQRTSPPHAFFQPDPNASWVKQAHAESGKAPYYWPLSPFVLDETLYVGLLRVQSAAPSGPFNLPFQLVGTDLARIQNPTDPPEQWKVEISSLSASKGAIPGSAWVVDGAHVYAFAYQNTVEGRTPQMLTRLARQALERWPSDLSQEIETLSRSGEWVSSLVPARAKILMHDDATEMSVHFSEKEKAWLAIYSDPTPASKDAQKGVVWLRRAERLTGPWSPPQPLAVVPEQSPGHRLAQDPNLFCYAGKAHPQFGGPDGLIVTYVCNLYARSEEEIPGTLERLRESPGIYRPRAMRLKIPQAPSDR